MSFTVELHYCAPHGPQCRLQTHAGNFKMHKTPLISFECIFQCILRGFWHFGIEAMFLSKLFLPVKLNSRIHSEGLWLSTDISYQQEPTSSKYWRALQIPLNIFVQRFAETDRHNTSWFPGRASKLLRVRHFGIFLSLIGFQHPSIGAFYWGDRHGVGGPWRTLVFDQGWRWCFSIQPWSRPQSMATPSTIFNGDLRPPPNSILSRVAWHGDSSNVSEDCSIG